MELDNGITTQIADAVIELLEEMEDKNGDKVLAKVNLGRIKKLSAHNGPVSEVYINDETDFEYNLDGDESTGREVEVIIAIYVKDPSKEKSERDKLNIKDLTITLIENNPTLDGLTTQCEINRVENGSRAEGETNKPLLFGASMIHVLYSVEDIAFDDDSDFDEIKMRGELIDS